MQNSLTIIFYLYSPSNLWKEMWTFHFFFIFQCFAYKLEVWKISPLQPHKGHWHLIGGNILSQVFLPSSVVTLILGMEAKTCWLCEDGHVMGSLSTKHIYREVRYKHTWEIDQLLSTISNHYFRWQLRVDESNVPPKVSQHNPGSLPGLCYTGLLTAQAYTTWLSYRCTLNK